ncbi:MAG: barstar family protein [Alphaproteobacteria bacterium]
MSMQHPTRRVVINGTGADDCPTQITRLYEQLGINAGRNLDALADVLTDPNWLPGPAVVCWLACPKSRSGWQATMYNTISEAAAKRDDLTFVER